MSQRFVPHLVAACLLLVACRPIAAADSPAASKDGPFRVELPDGASVELVGVSEPPPGERGWWRPDGSPLANVPGGNGVSTLQPFENSIVRRFAVSVVTDGKADVNEPGPQGPDVVWYAQSSGPTTKERVGNKILEKRQFIAAMPPDSRTSIVVKYAGGPWKTLASVGPKGAASFGFEHGAGVVWDSASDEDGAARIAAAYHVEDPLTRIVAVDERGEEHESEPRMGGTANNVRLQSARFPGLPIARVKAFRFQSRTFDHEIEFRYVSLHAGQRNPVRMYLDGFRYLPKTTTASEPSNPVKVSSAETPAHAQTATEGTILKRILANWRARQDRTKSFRFAWNTRMLEMGGRGFRVHNLRRTLWVLNDDRFRFERAYVGSRDQWPRWDRYAREFRACDGSQRYVLEWVRDQSDVPQGAIRPGRETREFDHLECKPLYIAFRPLTPFLNGQDPPFHIDTQNAVVDGVPCIKLQRPGDGATETCWVDPKRDDLVVCWEQTVNKVPRWRVAINYRASPQSGWLPERWSCKDDFREFEFACQATTSAVNEQLPADVFRIDFPPGALVVDVPAHKEYVIARDGTRALAPPFDSVSSPEFRKALDTVEPFIIEPEPVQDAILFLSIHHKLPIDLDRPAFEKAGLRGDAECQCDIEHMTMREQLRWMSAALPKPMHLIEKKGELLLTPASTLPTQ